MSCSKAEFRDVAGFTSYMLLCLGVTILILYSLIAKPKHVKLFSALAILSLGTTWYYMLRFFSVSYASWASEPTQTAAPAECLNSALWLRDTHLFEQAWWTVVATPARFWWSQQIFFFTTGWSVFVGRQGNRRAIAHLWAYMLLATMGEFVVGIIGMGDMGRLYAKRLSRGGWKVHACDQEQNFSRLQKDLASDAGIVVLKNGHEVARTSDYILYNVEASMIDSVVREYGKSTKPGAIVGGQTSCKAPETKAFECHLPQACEIVSLHSLHGPSTDPQGQPLVQMIPLPGNFAIIPHRASPESVSKVQEIVACLESKTAIMTAVEHDSITANTQVLIDLYTLAFRIFAQKWHVYAGLSLFNPFSETHLAHYATSARTLTALVMEGRHEELRQRLRTTAAVLNHHRRAPAAASQRPEGTDLPPLPLILSIAIMATGDMWVAMNINPWAHLHCATPQYRQWLGIVSDFYSAFGLTSTSTPMPDDFGAFGHVFEDTGHWLAGQRSSSLATVAVKDLDNFKA
ncbi:hypothetical protein DV735_g3012, partial [Chaetothyriales sp. CBS 134920]